MIKKDIVQKFLDCGLNILPCKPDKRPAMASWKILQKNLIEPKDFPSLNLGIITGAISGNLECIDIDEKYNNNSQKIIKQMSVMIKSHNPKLWDSLLIQRTVSGGFHLIYRCEEIGGNQKFASRYTTPSERKSEPNEKVKVLVESRGEGGYFLTMPSRGYKVIQGSYGKIPTITTKERRLLISCAESLEQTGAVMKPQYDNDGKSPWGHYDEVKKCEDVLQEFGWSVVGADAQRVYVKRAGQTTAAHSGNVLIESNLFKSWSTSTSFEPEKAYAPSGVYCVLKHDGDWKACAIDLLDQGFGERRRVQPISEVSSYVISAASIDKDSSDYYDGNIELSRGLNLPELDRYLSLRKNTFYTVTGGKACGKTTLVLYLLAQDAWVNGAKTICVCYENDVMELQDEVIGFLVKNDAKWIYQNQRDKYDEAKDFFHKHFTFLHLPPDADFYKITEIVKQINDVDKHDQLWIDPLFKVPETDDYSKNKRIAAFAEPFANDVMTLIISMHPKGSTQREGGQPQDLDAEFGACYSNAADITLTFHRAYKDADESTRNTVNVSIDKVRSKKLKGGRETITNCPIKFEYVWKTHQYRIWVPDVEMPDIYNKFDDVFFK